MISLRSWLERGRRHRWLWPLFVILLVLMLFAVALHATCDGATPHEGELVCLVAGLLLALVWLVPRPPDRVLTRFVLGRGPPRRLCPTRLAPRPLPSPAGSAPLRL